jgi:predicted nucleic acid-binding protein
VRAVPVVDASVVIDWVAPDVDPAGTALTLLGQWAADSVTVVAPRLLMEEVANALLTGVRRGRWTGADADRAFDHLEALPIELLDRPEDLSRAWDLSRRYDEHPVYDMVYLALAQRLDEPFFTADLRLVERVRLPWVRPVPE